VSSKYHEIRILSLSVPNGTKTRISIGTRKGSSSKVQGTE
jgi:hypothetical protein